MANRFVGGILHVDIPSINDETQPNENLQLWMALANRTRRSCLPARFFSVAKLEFYPATRHLDFDAGFTLHTRPKEQSANH
jgi:hypothetical protein